jgi:hypothetical protein
VRWLAVALVLAACSSVQTVRLHPESVEVGPGLRPIAAIHAEVSSFYLVGIPIPGNLTYDRVVNRMLLVTAKTMGADKIVGLTIADDCASMCFSKIFGFRSLRASAIAVQVTEAPAAGER